MTHYHAVMIDECGQEFGAGVEAKTRDEAYDLLYDMYPENRGIVQLEDPSDTQRREEDMWARLDREQDGDFREWEYEQHWG